RSTPLIVTSKPAASGTLSAAPAVTSSRSFGGGGVEQVTENDAEVDPPAGTFTVRCVPLLTEQFDAMPLRVTVWLPAARLVNVTPSFVPMCWLPPPPPLTVTV